MRWNLASDGNLWILKPESVREVGCIHTCQGLDLDYVGVIIGPDLICRNEKIITDPKKRARTDSSVKGYKSLCEKDADQAAIQMDAIIKNTYRTLMTRGMKGCYVYFVDKETETFFKSRISTLSAYREETIRPSDIAADKPQFVPSIEQDIPDWLQYKEYLPVRSLKAAATRFGTEDYPEELGWMKIDTKRKLTADMFVAQVTGKSMEPTIIDGSYCVFQFERGGSRNGKVVLVQSRQVTDRETNQTYTVKRYSSEKELFDDGTWRHKKITLLPDNKFFEAIVLENVPGDDFRVIAEFVAVVGD